MNQWITYLYEYEGGKRVRNVGFAKVEQGDDCCAIHLHGKGLDVGEEMKLQVALFYVHNGKCVRVPLGEIKDVTSVLSHILQFHSEDVGGVEVFEKLAGLILTNANQEMYIASWTEEDVDYTEEEHVEHTLPEEEVEEVEEYIAPSSRIYKKIQRQDLAKLPRREWSLANNSFLMHGCHNYHHLLYVEDGEDTYIGVPGIYHEQEAMVARTFGFPVFHRMTDANLTLTDEEQNRLEDFGYWCRQVARGTL